jgi:hypothetical protein
VAAAALACGSSADSGRTEAVTAAPSPGKLHATDQPIAADVSDACVAQILAAPSSAWGGDATELANLACRATCQSGPPPTCSDGSTCANGYCNNGAPCTCTKICEAVWVPIDDAETWVGEELDSRYSGYPAGAYPMQTYGQLVTSDMFPACTMMSPNKFYAITMASSPDMGDGLGAYQDCVNDSTGPNGFGASFAVSPGAQEVCSQAYGLTLVFIDPPPNDYF